MWQVTRSMRLVAIVGALLALFASSALADNGAQTTMLLTPSGQPVGGPWQQWMNDSYMPTYNGPMVLDLDSTDIAACGTGASGCSSSATFTTDVAAPLSVDPETVLNIPLMRKAEAITASLLYDLNMPRLQDLGAFRTTLLYEQAHVVDFADLTDSDRLAWMSLWGVQVPAAETVDTYWWQGESTFTISNAPVIAEWFAADYSICATVRKWTYVAALQYPLDTKGFPAAFSDLDVDWSRRNGKWRHTGRIPSRDRWALQTQRESCGLIRSWIDHTVAPTPQSTHSIISVGVGPWI